MTLLWVCGISFGLLLLGTLIGRFYAPHERPLRQEAQEGKAYARGLVRVLEGEASGAIRELTAALAQNSRTVEAYFALGTLFRQQGELERAVRVHQSILIRRDLDRSTRLSIHFQLALDFRAAGFPRRAIKALEWIIAHDARHVPALRELGALLEGEKQWERAAMVYRKLGKVAGEPHGPRIGSLLAQVAREEIEGGRAKVARKALRRAVSVAPDSIHVLHVLGMYQRAAGDEQGALKAWTKAVRLRPDLIATFAPLVEQTLSNLGRGGEMARLLGELRELAPRDVHVRLAHARWQSQRDPASALAALTALCRDSPRLLPARREVARLALQSGDPDVLRSSLSSLLQLLERAERGFRCSCCEHSAAELFWRCDRCGSWDTVRVAWGRRAGERVAPKQDEERT